MSQAGTQFQMRRCFQALLSTFDLQFRVFRIPFLACFLACLVCTFQIKIVYPFINVDSSGATAGRQGENV